MREWVIDGFVVSRILGWRLLLALWVFESNVLVSTLLITQKVKIEMSSSESDSDKRKKGYDC